MANVKMILVKDNEPIFFAKQLEVHYDTHNCGYQLLAQHCQTAIKKSDIIYNRGLNVVKNRHGNDCIIPKYFVNFVQSEE